MNKEIDHSSVSRILSVIFTVLASCCACSVVSHPLMVSERILYSHTAWARALRSTHPDDAVLSFAHIVPDVLYSVASESHTAFARPSGDSGVNGDISPVIYPRAVISASAVSVIVDSPVENAMAHNVPDPVSVILASPVP